MAELDYRVGVATCGLALAGAKAGGKRAWRCPCGHAEDLPGGDAPTCPKGLPGGPGSAPPGSLEPAFEPTPELEAVRDRGYCPQEAERAASALVEGADPEDLYARTAAGRRAARARLAPADDLLDAGEARLAGAANPHAARDLAEGKPPWWTALGFRAAAESLARGDEEGPRAEVSPGRALADAWAGEISPRGRARLAEDVDRVVSAAVVAAVDSVTPPSLVANFAEEAERRGVLNPECVAPNQVLLEALRRANRGELEAVLVVSTHKDNGAPDAAWSSCDTTELAYMARVAQVSADACVRADVVGEEEDPGGEDPAG